MKSKNIALCLIFLSILFCTAASGSVLGDAAAALGEKSWVRMPANSSLSAINFPANFTAYADGAVWDPVRKQVRWVGSGGTCCTDGRFYMLTYDEATDRWTNPTTPFQASGHGYDGNTINPATGMNYAIIWSSNVIKTWNGSWGALPPHPLGSSCCMSLTWFPDINSGNGGLVLNGGNGKAAWYNGSGWTSVPGATASPWGSIEVFSEYNPVQKVIWMGGGSYGATGTERVSYIMDTQFNMTKMQNAPFTLKANASLQSCDPVSGLFLVYSFSTRAWWGFDAVANSWSQITGMKNQPDLGGQYAFQVVIPEYNVIMIFKQSAVYLYRHSLPSGTELAAGARGPQARISLSPNPFHSVVTIGIPAGFESARIFNVSGKKVADLGCRAQHGQVAWNADGLPSGVYLLKVTGVKGAVTRRLLLY